MYITYITSNEHTTNKQQRNKALSLSWSDMTPNNLF